MTGVLVHEWIEAHGGAEQVLDAMAAEFPDADIACLWDDAPQRYPGRRVVDSWLARTPLRRHKAAALPMMLPTWWRRPGSYDWALVGSYAFAAQARFPASPDLRKLVYVHSPARYVWEPELDGRGSSRFVRAVAPPLRRLDRRLVAGAHAFATNSAFVRDRVARTWGRDSVVIPPPVAAGAIAAGDDHDLTDAERRVLDALPGVFVLGASRFVGYKRLDLVIEAGEHADLPVVIAGGGPLEQQLREQGAAARVPVTFVSRPSSALLHALLRRAAVFVFPAVEDFGILPVEAMAAGTPVLSSARGGVTESVLDGVTGAHVAEWRREPVRAAVERALAASAQDCRDRAMDFDEPVFRRRLRTWVDEQLAV